MDTKPIWAFSLWELLGEQSRPWVVTSTATIGLWGLLLATPKNRQWEKTCETACKINRSELSMTVDLGSPNQSETQKLKITYAPQPRFKLIWVEEWGSKNCRLKKGLFNKHLHKAQWRHEWICKVCSSLQRLSLTEVNLVCQMHPA